MSPEIALVLAHIIWTSIGLLYLTFILVSYIICVRCIKTSIGSPVKFQEPVIFFIEPHTHSYSSPITFASFVQFTTRIKQIIDAMFMIHVHVCNTWVGLEFWIVESLLLLSSVVHMRMKFVIICSGDQQTRVGGDPIVSASRRSSLLHHGHATGTVQGE